MFTRSFWRRQGGFLLHSASAIRNGKAFLFAGVSEAGKTTISRLAPPDATLLTDEISYVRKQDAGYVAYGTPFTGELAKLGENVSAPIAALYLAGQGSENRIDPISPAEATRSLLANLLFFAEDEDLVQSIFHSAFEFVSRVPVSPPYLCARCPGLGVDWMSRGLYVARNPRVAARSLDGEMMIMSGARLHSLHSEQDRHHPVASRRRHHAA